MRSPSGLGKMETGLSSVLRVKEGKRKKIMIATERLLPLAGKEAESICPCAALDFPMALGHRPLCLLCQMMTVQVRGLISLSQVVLKRGLSAPF